MIADNGAFAAASQIIQPRTRRNPAAIRLRLHARRAAAATVKKRPQPIARLGALSAAEADPLCLRADALSGPRLRLGKTGLGFKTSHSPPSMTISYSCAPLFSFVAWVTDGLRQHRIQRRLRQLGLSQRHCLILHDSANAYGLDYRLKSNRTYHMASDCGLCVNPANAARSPKLDIRAAPNENAGVGVCARRYTSPRFVAMRRSSATRKANDFGAGFCLISDVGISSAIVKNSQTQTGTCEASHNAQNENQRPPAKRAPP